MTFEHQRFNGDEDYSHYRDYLDEDGNPSYRTYIRAGMPPKDSLEYDPTDDIDWEGMPYPTIWETTSIVISDYFESGPGKARLERRPFFDSPNKLDLINWQYQYISAVERQVKHQLETNADNLPDYDTLDSLAMQSMLF